MNEDIYEEKVIPGGSIVVANIWYVGSLPILNLSERFARSMMHDERYFPDPDTFNPDRHLTSTTDVSNNKNMHHLNTFRPDDPSSILFGFGRRRVVESCLKAH